MTDALTLLTQDHRKVEELFSEYEQTGDWSTAQTICDEITLHAQIEEEIVYPVLAELDPALTEEAQHEHDEAKRLIAQIRGGGDRDEATALMTKLQEAIDHHVQEEESEAFPKLEQGAGDRLDDMGRRIEERKRAAHAA
jgi:iron-sulfur cluster repair protein YtfE (RIC family)